MDLIAEIFLSEGEHAVYFFAVRGIDVEQVGATGIWTRIETRDCRESSCCVTQGKHSRTNQSIHCPAPTQQIMRHLMFK